MKLGKKITTRRAITELFGSVQTLAEWAGFKIVVGRGYHRDHWSNLEVFPILNGRRAFYAGEIMTQMNSNVGIVDASAAGVYRVHVGDRVANVIITGIFQGAMGAYVVDLDKLPAPYRFAEKV